MYQNAGLIDNSHIDNVVVQCEDGYRVAGAVSGLVIILNGTQSMPLNAGATTFSFATPERVSVDPSYVRVTSQPTHPSKTCQFNTVAGGGNATTTLVQNADIVARIECNTNTYSITGAITGLSGNGLRIEMSGTSVVTTAHVKSGTPLAGSTGYLYAGGLHYGDTISTLTIVQHPSMPAQFCSFSSGGTSYSYTAGPVTGNVALPSVVCSTNTLQGTVSGYTASTGLVVRYNDTTTATSQQIALEPGDAFTFPTMIGHSYTLSIVAQLYNPGYDCLFSNNATAISGTVSSSSVIHNTSCNSTPLAEFLTILMAGVTNTITFAGPAGATLCYRTDGGNPACALATGGTAYSRGGECASGSVLYNGSFAISSTTTFRTVSCLTLLSYAQSSTTLIRQQLQGRRRRRPSVRPVVCTTTICP